MWVEKTLRYPVTSHSYRILFCNTVQYISRDITEVVYVNSFNKVSVFLVWTTGWYAQSIPLISPSPTHWYLCEDAVPKILGSPVDLFGFRGCSTIFGQPFTLGGWKGSQCRDIVRGNYSRRSSISSPVISWTTTCGHILYSSSHFNRTLTLNKYASSSAHHQKRIRCICPSNPSKMYDEGEWAILNCNS